MISMEKWRCWDLYQGTATVARYWQTRRLYETDQYTTSMTYAGRCNMFLLRMIFTSSIGGKFVVQVNTLRTVDLTHALHLHNVDRRQLFARRSFPMSFYLRSYATSPSSRNSSCIMTVFVIPSISGTYMSCKE